MKSKSIEIKPSIKLERSIATKKLYGVVTLVPALMTATLLMQTTLKVAAAPPSTAPSQNFSAAGTKSSL
jgi:hypothetical protein